MIHTVLGCIEKGSQGLTLMHEHIFLDLRNKFAGTGLYQTETPVTLELAGQLRKNHRLLKDNMFLGDENTAYDELQLFKQSSGGTIVDMSCRGMGGNPEALARISRFLGIHIVECTGFYTQAMHPSYVKDLSGNSMTELFVRDLTVGIDKTGIRAGIIGEIGTSAEITHDEWKTLAAAAKAQRETGATISVHIDPWVQNGLTVLSYLEKSGADISRVIIDHTDALLDTRYCLTLLEAGCVIELDNFGKSYETPGLKFDTDSQRIDCVCELVSRGWQGKIVLSTDICLKTDLCCFGGCGYGHIPRTILPVLHEKGISSKVIHEMTVETPGILLNF